MTLASPISLSAGTNGIAVVAVDFENSYTNGTGGNQNYNDGNLAVAAGSANNVALSSGIFSPRVANMTFFYGCN